MMNPFNSSYGGGGTGSQVSVLGGIDSGSSLPRRKKRPEARPKIRTACFDDYERIAALQIRNGLTAKSREEWIGLWADNPAYRLSGGNWPIGWVLETEAAEIVGYIANVPVACQFGNRDLKCAVIGSWVTDPGYRGYSMIVLNSVTRQPNVDLFITNTAGPRAEPSLRVFRWSRVPVGSWDRSYFWITGCLGFSRCALRRRTDPFPALIAFPLALGLWCGNRFLAACARVRRTGCTVTPCSRFDASFDAFWEELKQRNSKVLSMLRTRATLEWHFRSALDRRMAWLLAVYAGDHLTAYAIFDRQDNTRIGLKRVRLVDFQALENPEAALGSFLLWMLRKCREEHVHVLESPGWPREKLVRTGILAPYCRKLDAWRYYYKANTDELGNILGASEAWAPSLYDGDASL
jgi:hypothetical protein